MGRQPGLWVVPKIWSDGECFILGGGPSLASVDLEPLKGRRCIAVNNAYREPGKEVKVRNWIDVMFFGDLNWYHWEGKNLLEFAGLKVTKVAELVGKPGIKVVGKRNSPWGISTDPGILTWNFTSGASAINLAYHFGVKRIILLGFDMRTSGGQHNYHKDYPASNNPKAERQNLDGRYERFMRPFPQIAEDLKNLNVECLNATEGSALTVFPMVKLEDVLCLKS